MINLKILCLSFLLCSVLINCSSAQDKSLPTSSSTITVEAKRFESKEGNFSINIYQAPFHTRNLGSEITDKKGTDVGKQFLWKFEKITYTAMYSNPFDSDGNAMPQSFDEMNSGSRKGIARQGAKLISEKEISYGKYPGKEFRYVASNGAKFIGRNYLIEACA
jgi:hypothetical protein